MSIYDDLHITPATYWAPTTRDKFGAVNFASPITVHVRWYEAVEQTVGTDGVVHDSTSKVFVDYNVAEAGYIALGTHTGADPGAVNAAYKIKRVKRIPNYTADETLYVAVI
jgi:hypothetical protein